jgi:hypothetical protein
LPNGIANQAKPRRNVRYLSNSGQTRALASNGLSANDPSATFDQELQDHRVEPGQTGHRYWSPLK